MRKDLEDLIDDFSLFDDWEDRYRYLIDLGKTLPVMDKSLKTEENLVRGCASQVWMVICNKGGLCYFEADSEALIVRGLIAILHKIYQGKSLSEVREVDLEDLFSRLGLMQHLSPNRRNGFFSMVEKINNGLE